MRQKRAKTYKKLMSLYSMTFGFRQPYQVLIDSGICDAAIKMKIDLPGQLSTTLQGETKPMITQCCIHELYLQGHSKQPAVDLAKLFERRMCNHRVPIPGDECLASVIGDTNKHRYIVATESHTLRIKLRQIPAVPLVHLNRSVMVLEPPSDVTLKSKTLAEEKSLSGPSTKEAKPREDPQRKKRKGPKGPNPLSVRKKAKAPQQPPIALKRKREEEEESGNEEADPSESTTQAKRKRKRIRRGKIVKPETEVT